MTDDEFLRKLSDDQEDPTDDLYTHFEELEFTNWCDVSNETSRLIELIQKEICGELEEGYESFFECIAGPTASAGSDSAYRTIAKMLGIDFESLKNLS